MLARLGIGEIIVIGVVAFLIFGPQKLPELGKSLGETIRNFKQATKETVTSAVDQHLGEQDESENNTEDSTSE